MVPGLYSGIDVRDDHPEPAGNLDGWEVERVEGIVSYEQVAPDAAEQLRRWDAGGVIWSIEMGGLGPGYEQAIQVLAIEIVRDNLGTELPTEGPDLQKFGNSTLERITDQGWTGAQFGAARNLAYRWIKYGPPAIIAEVDKERHIQVSNTWPLVTKKS